MKIITRYPTSKEIKTAITLKLFFRKKLTFLSKLDISEAITWYCTRPTFGPCLGEASLTSLTVFYLFQPEVDQDPRNEDGSQSPTEHLVGFEPSDSE